MRQDGVAFPDTCVGTDSHTPHVDALGVIAIGVGGLEAENVMLGRASWMRLPEIVGVELDGQARNPASRRPTSCWRSPSSCASPEWYASYLEFFGAGAAALTLGDRATISNMAPEYGATAAMFYIDRQTIDYLKLTGRIRRAGASWSKPTRRTAGLWSDSLKGARYDRVLEFDLSSVVRNMAGPSNPHARVATADLAAKGIAGQWQETPGQMPDGAVIIAAITSCTNTCNPRNVIAAGLLARNANRRGLVRKPWVKSSLAPGSKTVALVPGGGRPEVGAREARLRHRGLRLHDLQRHVRRAGSEDPAGDHRPRPVRDGGAFRQPQLRRPDPPVRQAGIPGLAATRRGLCDRRHDSLRHRARCARRRTPRASRSR